MDEKLKLLLPHKKTETERGEETNIPEMKKQKAVVAMKKANRKKNMSPWSLQKNVRTHRLRMVKAWWLQSM